MEYTHLDIASACIKPDYLKRSAELLAGSSVAASTVIGFPHGGSVTAINAPRWRISS